MLASTESPTDDIRHAVNNAIGAITTPNQPEFTMLIGPDVASRLLDHQRGDQQ